MLSNMLVICCYLSLSV